MTRFLLLLSEGVGPFAAGFAEGGGPFLFQHVPKTAGTSLTVEMRQWLAPYRNIHVPPAPGLTGQDRADAMREAVDGFLADDARVRFRSASGHLHHPKLSRILRGMPHAWPFTVVRDPVERVISDYRYSRSEAHPDHAAVRHRYPDLQCFARDPKQQDKTWRMLAPPRAVLDDGTLGDLLDRFAFVGRVETLERDFAFLTALVGPPRRMRARANRTEATRETAVEVDEGLRREIRALNAQDEALVAAVAEGLARRDGEMRAFVEARRAAWEGTSA